MKKCICLIIATVLICITSTFKYDTVYAEQTTYLVFNKLMAYPEICLNEKNTNSTYNDENYITPLEFVNILNELYKNDYVLVNFSKSAPAGKKPIILIFNNLNYISSTKSNGFIDKLIIDKSGNISTYTSKRSINDRILNNNECIPLLESFITAHPLFSYNGARAIIALNNDDGIFGYKTSKSNATSKYDIKHAIKIANKLSSLGYTFACSGFENETATDINFAAQVNTWNLHTSLITGKTEMYITDTTIDSEYKINLLKDIGVKTILNYQYDNIKKINGKTLREDLSLNNYFDCDKVYDTQSRTKPYFSS